MSERPLFKQCPSCQQFSPEESGACLQCGHSFDSERTHTETREVGEAEGQSRQPPEMSEVEPPKKKRGCLKKLGLGALIIVGLVIVLGVIVSLLPDDMNDTATSVQSASTPVPTFTTTAAGSTVTETTGQSDTQAQAQPTKPQDPPTPVPSTSTTPTVEEALFDFVLCDRLSANLLMSWGQVPDLIYSDDPKVSGDIEPGDYVRFLMPEPDANGSIWIEVYPHDHRAVGNTDNMVWIDWAGLVQFRSDQAMFTCEDDDASTAQEAAPPTPAPPSATPEPMIEVNSLINVREGPGTTFGVIGTASAGQRFPVTGKNPAGDWWRISYNGQTGWVFGNLVKVVNLPQSGLVQDTLPPASEVESPHCAGDELIVFPPGALVVGATNTPTIDLTSLGLIKEIHLTSDAIADDHCDFSWRDNLLYLFTGDRITLLTEITPVSGASLEEATSALEGFFSNPGIHKYGILVHDPKYPDLQDMFLFLAGVDLYSSESRSDRIYLTLSLVLNSDIEWDILDSSD